MDFYITVSSGPTPNLPNNTTTFSKYYLEKAIELDGEYEVALVQSVFKDVNCSRLATLKIYTDSVSNDDFVFYMDAEEGEEYETVLKKLNNDIWMTFHSYVYKKVNSSMDIEVSVSYDEIPTVKFDSKTNEFYFNLPKDWKFELFNQEKSKITAIEQNKFKFSDSHFYYIRHFYVLSNLVDDQVTGDEALPILSNFVLNITNPSIGSKEFKYPQYIRLSKNHISEFTLEYTPNLFHSHLLRGTIVSTLHFRKLNGF